MPDVLALGSDSLHSFMPQNIAVRVEPMLRIQGYRDLSRVRPKVRQVATEMASMASEVFEPVVRYRCCRIERQKDQLLQLAPGVQLHADAFKKFLPQCKEVIVFVLTIGERFDERMDELQSGDQLLEALFLDTAGWLGVEAVSKQFAATLRSQALAAGVKLTRRLSPGYSFKIDNQMCEWSLYEQEQLFSLFGDEQLPVRMLESCAMLPRMSRSGLYGLKESTASVFASTDSGTA